MANSSHGVVPRASRLVRPPGGIRLPPIWTLAPTDLTFLWNECPRCFYRKVALGQPRPRAPFPGVFSAIDRAMKDALIGRRAEALGLGAPAGLIGSPDRWVRSDPIKVAGGSTSVVFGGRLDALVAYDDGSDGVVDFKTSLPGQAHVPLYGRQLHAYTWALERPASGQPSEVRALGLLCFTPGRFVIGRSGAALRGALRWVEVPRDDVAFERFLAGVVRTLEAPEPPAPAVGCGWCRWRTSSTKTA